MLLARGPQSRSLSHFGWPSEDGNEFLLSISGLGVWVTIGKRPDTRNPGIQGYLLLGLGWTRLGKWADTPKPSNAGLSAAGASLDNL